MKRIGYIYIKAHGNVSILFQDIWNTSLQITLCLSSALYYNLWWNHCGFIQHHTIVCMVTPLFLSSTQYYNLCGDTTVAFFSTTNSMWHHHGFLQHDYSLCGDTTMAFFSSTIVYGVTPMWFSSASINYVTH